MTNEYEHTTHTYKISGKVVPSVTQVLNRAGLVDDSFYTADGAQRGTFVHEACELFDKNLLDFDRLDPALEGYVEAWQSFRKLMPVKFDVIEEPFWSEEHGFGGTIDRAHGDIVGDIKTGQFPAWLALQLGGYSILRPASSAWGVQLKSNGKFSMKTIGPYELAMARRQFLAALEKVKNG